MDYTSWLQGGHSIANREITNHEIIFNALVLFLCITNALLFKKLQEHSKKLQEHSKKLHEHSERWARVDESFTLREAFSDLSSFG